MRRLLALAAVAALLGLPLPAARASCAGPGLSLEGVSPTRRAGRAVPVPVVAGRPLDVVGEGFVGGGCDDTRDGSDDGGCDDGPSPARRVPRDAVPLDLVVDGQRQRLGTADADAAAVVRWHVTLPAGLRPGAVELAADGARLPLVVAAGG